MWRVISNNYGGVNFDLTKFSLIWLAVATTWMLTPRAYKLPKLVLAAHTKSSPETMILIAPCACFIGPGG